MLPLMHVYFALYSILLVICEAAYDPNWDSLDTRPLPDWFDQGKLGIFIVWGIYSQVGFGDSGSDWVWWQWQGDRNPKVVKFFDDNYRPNTTYADIAAEFRAEFYDPNQWADLVAASGAKYIVMTTKHHEGYTLWPSKYSWNWNSMEVGARRDLVGEMAEALRKRTNLHLGLYYSLFEWFNPLYLDDKASNYTLRTYPDRKPFPELRDLVSRYKPDVIWSDGDWEAPDTYWNSTAFIAWLYNDSPVKDTVVTNDRWGAGIPCHHGGFFTCVDKYNPGVLQPRKWENCMTLDNLSWGYRRNMNNADVLTVKELIGILAATVSCGGNLLVNVGPTGDGTIPAIFQERLSQLGQWMAVNSAAIYGTSPWSHQNDTTNPNVWFTSKKVASDDGLIVYAIVLEWDGSSTNLLGSPVPSKDTTVKILGGTGFLDYKLTDHGVEIALPMQQALPNTAAWAYVLELTHLTNRGRPKEIMPLPERFRKNSKITLY